MKSMMNSNNESITILIAEDSKTQAERLKYLLEKQNYHVIVAENGKEALDCILKKKPSLVISDIVMPEMNGYELCKEIKSDQSTQDIPVILLTSLTHSEDVLEGISCGADNFITKPYKEDYLCSHIEQILANVKLYDSERKRIGVEMFFGGKRRFITASQQQMLTLLISTYEAAVQKNEELVQSQNELKKLNDNLEGLVIERTAELSAEIEIRKLSEEKIKTSEKRLLEAQKIAAFGNWELNCATNHLAWSDEIYRIFEIDKEEFNASYEAFLDVIHPGDREVVKKIYEESVKNKQPYAIVHRLLMKDKSIKYIEEQCETYFDESGNPLRSLGTVQDITERKLAEEALRKSEEHFRLLFENSGIGIALVDMVGHPIKSNLTLQNIVGYDEAELSSMSFTEFTHADDVQKDWKLYTELMEGKREIYSMEKRYIHKDGHIVYAQLTVSLIRNPDGKPEYAIGMVENITERKLAEDEIRDLNASLEIKIEERTEQLVQAKTEADRANLAKSEFLSRMSHELRTPLNSILGFAQLLQRSETNPENMKRINWIMSSGNHLLDLINEVLDLARIESGRMLLSLEPVQLTNIITETLDIVGPLAEKNAVKLKWTEPPVNHLFVKSDQKKLKQVLINLVNNAVKYNREGGEVEIVISRTGENIRINICDTGIGIAAKEQYKLFEPFLRIGDEISEVEGTGLGLAVAKKLVLSMNGTIGVESEVGIGSTFWVELPQAESALESIGKTTDSHKTANGNNTCNATILYIEDNMSNIQLMEDILQSERPNINMVTEMYGKNAVKMANDYQPGLILLDLDLPDIHGIEVLNLLQADAATKSIPVLILSANAMTPTIEQLMAAGAKHYITKPLDVEKFLEMVDEFMCKVTY